MRELRVIQVLEVLKTNSEPLLVLCEDGLLYYAKTTFRTHPPFVDVINEIIGNYICKCWGINTPDICVLHIDSKLLKGFIDKNNIDCIYKKYNINELFFIGFKAIDSVTEVSELTLNAHNRNDLKRYSKPVDFLNIAFLDVWLGNNDRRITNPNLLLSQNTNGLDLFAIDHTQLFGNQDVYKALSLPIMDISQDKMLIGTELVNKICKFVGNSTTSRLCNSIQDNMGITLKGLPDFLDNMPRPIGLSKKGKDRIYNVLSDKERNGRIVNSFKNRLK